MRSMQQVHTMPAQTSVFPVAECSSHRRDMHEVFNRLPRDARFYKINDVVRSHGGVRSPEEHSLRLPRFNACVFRSGALRYIGGARKRACEGRSRRLRLLALRAGWLPPSRFLLVPRRAISPCRSSGGNPAAQGGERGWLDGGFRETRENARAR
eukprot:3786831-Prymnesium_polylepis.1